MLGFFPDPYPDELLYSACARYSDRVNYRGKINSLIEILGKTGSAVLDFPSRIDYIISILPSGNNYSAEKIISENTLLPFYEPFLPCNRAKLARHQMKNYSLGSISNIITKPNKSLEYLRYCPICVLEDKKDYGETYWHRNHQLPGILVCSIHSCFLENSLVEWGKQNNRIHFLSAEKHLRPKKPIFLKTTDDQQILLKLAKSARWLLSQTGSNPRINLIRNRYYNQLLKNKLAHYNGRIRKKHYYQAFNDYYSMALLNALNCPIGSTDRSWILRIVEKSKTHIVQSPIKHLLMINFLGFTAEEFFNSFVEFKPFVDGPYPCFNGASEHYRELRIQQYQVFDNLSKHKNKQGIPLGVFRCDCGFTYQRLGPDNSENDRFKYSSIREFGTIWENALKTMWDDSLLTKTAIAKKLKVSRFIVTNAAYRLKLIINREKITKKIVYHKVSRKTFLDLKKVYRKTLIEILQENPQISRNEINKLAKFAYLWLMRNDSEWMQKHLPPIKKYRKITSDLNWEKIDKETYRLVKIACKEIYSLIPPKQVCITAVTNKIGNKSRIARRTLKLPKTTQILEKQLESNEDFAIRKLKLAEKRFIEEKIIPTKSQLIDHSSRTLYYAKNERICKEVDSSLNIIKKRITFY